MKPQQQTTRPAFKELNVKKAKSFEAQVKEMKGVKEASLSTKAKRIIVAIKLESKTDETVFEKVIELASTSQLKVGRSYYIEDALTVNLTQG